MTDPAASGRRYPAQASHLRFLAGSAVVFAAGFAAMILSSRPMPAMDGMTMPVSMPVDARRRMARRTPVVPRHVDGDDGRDDAASLMPMLWRFRRTIGSVPRPGWLTVLAGVGYFVVWGAAGAVVYASGVMLASAAMQWPALAEAIPFAGGIVVLGAGVLQFTPWKARQLACCTAMPGQPLRADAITALRHGVHLGLCCCACCGGLMTILLVVGVMDLRAMLVVTAAITAERFVPRIVPALGVAAIAAGLFLIVRAG